MQLFFFHFHLFHLFLFLDPLQLFILIVSEIATFPSHLFYKVVDHLLLPLTFIILQFQFIFQQFYPSSYLCLSLKCFHFAIRLQDFLFLFILYMIRCNKIFFSICQLLNDTLTYSSEIIIWYIFWNYSTRIIRKQLPVSFLCESKMLKYCCFWWIHSKFFLNLFFHGSCSIAHFWYILHLCHISFTKCIICLCLHIYLFFFFLLLPIFGNSDYFFLVESICIFFQLLLAIFLSFSLDFLFYILLAYITCASFVGASYMASLEIILSIMFLLLDAFVVSAGEILILVDHFILFRIFKTYMILSLSTAIIIITYQS